MSTQETETTTTTETGSDSLTHDELKALIGETIDDRLKASGVTDKLAKLDMLDGIEGLIEKHKSTPMDQKGLLAEIDKLVDGKLSALRTSGGSNGGTEIRKGGPLSRWLGI